MERWYYNQKYLFYAFLVILIIPNILLCFTEPLSPLAKICNVLLPLGGYYVVMSCSVRCGKMCWILFPFVFLGAFQIVLLYLFGQSVIAVDMFLNLVTTNSTEALELLDNMLPALLAVIILYVPALILATVSVIRKYRLPAEFVRRERKRSGAMLLAGLIVLVISCRYGKGYELKSDLYPVNVCYNACLAVQREAKTKDYYLTSKDFTFRATSSHPSGKREIYVMVIGETSRALNWQMCGYGRETNPKLSGISGLNVFPKTLSESNTTHKSVPMLLSDLSAVNFDSVYYRKGIITAFKEAGYHTAFFSNQRYNHSFIDFFGKEADVCTFIRETDGNHHPDLKDEELLQLVKRELDKGREKQLIVLHTYGSHFNYKERYPDGKAFFKPDGPLDVSLKYRPNLLNAYDNTIRYTDEFLASLISLLQSQQGDAVMVYTSDHGEDLYDDSRGLFLHASPVPSAYQIYVPFLVWTSDGYRADYPEKAEALADNRLKNISSSSSFFHTLLDLGGIVTPYRCDSLSVANPCFTKRKRVYLNDHNEARELKDIGMKETDFDLLHRWQIGY